jgi:hypothetical protein
MVHGKKSIQKLLENYLYVQVLGGCIFMTKRGAGSVVRFNIDTGERA